MTESKFRDAYFRDGLRKIDYVIVYREDIFQRDPEATALKLFLNSLQEKGLECEQERGLKYKDIFFEKIHFPEEVIVELAKRYEFDLQCDNLYYKNEEQTILKWFASVVTKPDPSDPIYLRASDILSGKKPTKATTSERVLIADKLLDETSYQNLDQNITLDGLIYDKIILDAFPVHDTTEIFPDEGPISERQLLSKYWVAISAMGKQQPLNLIERYFGPEVAFYFAWMGFYTQMLLYASVIGLLFILGTSIYLACNMSFITKQICESEIIICPDCENETNCPFTHLKDNCHLAMFSYIIENPVTVVYTTLMSFWGIIFIILWRRKEAILGIRWNVTQIKIMRTVRGEFYLHRPGVRTSSITGAPEFYIPKKDKCLRVVTSYILFSLMIASLVCLLLIQLVIRRLIKHHGQRSSYEAIRKNINIIETLCSSWIIAFMISYCSSLCRQVAKILSDLEVPRTDLQYENIFIIKSFLLACANNYFFIVYLAFFKGKFYTHPGDLNFRIWLGGLNDENCRPIGCIADLGILLISILITRRFIKHVKYILIPFAVYLSRKIFHRIKYGVHNLPSWESDYELVELSSNFIHDQYTQVVIQYGFVVCFIAAFPPAPILVLISNLFEMRKNAFGLLINSRRYIPKKVPNIGSWNTALIILTLAGAISNPFIFLFDTNFVPKLLYRLEHDNIDGLVKSTLSQFNASELKITNEQFKNLTVCYYVGQRYPPGNPKEYQRTTEYWHGLTIKSILFIAIENITLMVLLFLYYVIPRVPRGVKLKLEYEQRQKMQYLGRKRRQPSNKVRTFVR